MTEISSTAPRVRVPHRLSFDTAAVWVLTLTVALAAIMLIPVSSISFVYTKVAIFAIGGLIALALYILARLTRGNVIIPPFALIGALWLIPLAYLLSTLFSGVGFRAGLFGTQLETDTLGFMLLLSAFATLTALTFRRVTNYRVFFLVGAIVLGIILVAEVLFLILSRVMPSNISATANLVGTFTDLGMLVGLAISIALLSLRFLRMRGKVRIALWVGIALGLFTLALVNSTLIWVLVSLVALGLFIEAILRRRISVDDTDLEGVATISAEVDISSPSEDTISLAAPLVVLIIALFFLIGGSTIGNSLSTAFGTNSLDVRPSWTSTFDVGSHTYAASPIFGSGPNTFGAQWLRFRDRSLNSTVFWSVDFTSGIGLIPTSFVTTGLLGALAWIAFLGLFLFVGLRSLLFRAPTDPYARFASVASFVGALFVFALAVFSEPGAVVLVAGWAMVGIFVSTLRYTGTRQEWGVIFARNPRVGFVIVFGLTLLLLASVVAAYSVVEHYLADVAYNEASNALTAGNLTVATNDITRSILFAPSDRAYQVAAEIGISQMNQIAGNTALSPSDAQQQFQAALSNSIQAATMATTLGPNNYQNWVALGSVYQTVVPLKIDGAYAKSKAAYQHAITLDPTNPTLPYILAQLDIAQNDDADAETDLSQAISLKSDYTQAIFLLSQLEVQEGKSKDALQAAEAALYFSPNDPTILFQVGILKSANGDTPGAIQALTAAVQQNPQYANARFFLGVMYAIEGQYQQAIAQLQAVSALSKDNAAAVAADIAQLQEGKNPFPPSQLGALGIPQPGVTGGTDTSTAGTTGK